MNEKKKSRYTVSIYDPEDSSDTLYFTFVPKGAEPGRAPNGIPKRVPQFIVRVRHAPEDLSFDWTESDDPGAKRAGIESEIAARLKDRDAWIERVTSLVSEVEKWARELGWATRRLSKKLDDSWIGDHRVPSLHMQDDLCRVVLEPVGRSAPGAEGVIDLYAIPVGEHMAALYYYDGRWNLHYQMDRDSSVPVAQATALRLSKKALGKVLSEMKQHSLCES